MNLAVLLLIVSVTGWWSTATPLIKSMIELQEKTFNLNNKTNFVVYWGSTDNEGTLSDYCNDDIYDVIVLAFVDKLDENGIPKLSKTIMLSVGGADGSYKLTSNDYAKKVATHLWNMFLNGTDEKRPFGQSVVLDGVDFDIEKGAKEADVYWVTLINELRNLTKGDTSKRYYLSGAPQCVFPDEWFGPGPGTAVSEADLDFISIQFYNNYCGIQSFFEPDRNFNFDQWSTAVTKANEKMKILLGIPASRPAGQGYEPVDKIKQIYDTIKNATNFAGIMMWDAADAKRNNNFGQQIRNQCLS